MKNKKKKTKVDLTIIELENKITPGTTGDFCDCTGGAVACAHTGAEC